MTQQPHRCWGSRFHVRKVDSLHLFLGPPFHLSKQSNQIYQNNTSCLHPVNLYLSPPLCFHLTSSSCCSTPARPLLQVSLTAFNEVTQSLWHKSECHCTCPTSSSVSQLPAMPRHLASSVTFELQGRVSFHQEEVPLHILCKNPPGFDLNSFHEHNGELWSQNYSRLHQTDSLHTIQSKQYSCCFNLNSNEYFWGEFKLPIVKIYTMERWKHLRESKIIQMKPVEISL